MCFRLSHHGQLLIIAVYTPQPIFAENEALYLYFFLLQKIVQTGINICFTSKIYMFNMMLIPWQLIIFTY
jgi:hypothetical protein